MIQDDLRLLNITLFRVNLILRDLEPKVYFEVAVIHVSFVFFAKTKKIMEPQLQPHPASLKVVDFTDWACNTTESTQISLGKEPYNIRRKKYDSKSYKLLFS
jgi:hypothetical protein